MHIWRLWLLCFVQFGQLYNWGSTNWAPQIYFVEKNQTNAALIVWCYSKKEQILMLYYHFDKILLFGRKGGIIQQGLKTHDRIKYDSVPTNISILKHFIS